jgi:hypothetical protein
MRATVWRDIRPTVEIEIFNSEGPDRVLDNSGVLRGFFHVADLEGENASLRIGFTH